MYLPQVSEETLDEYRAAMTDEPVGETLRLMNAFIKEQPALALRIEHIRNNRPEMKDVILGTVLYVYEGLRRESQKQLLKDLFEGD